GVSFDPALREGIVEIGERGSGLVPALSGALLASTLIFGWALYRSDYYLLTLAERSHSEWNDWLRPARNAGLVAGLLATVAILVNLSYLLRRSTWAPLRFGALRTWMTAHVITGVGAGLLALLHCGFLWHQSPGGVALVSLGVLIGTGAMGRYLYAFLPRASNGRELALEEMQGKLASLQGQWEGDHPGYREWVEQKVQDLVAGVHWSQSGIGRVKALIGAPGRLRSVLREVRSEGSRLGVPEERVRDLVQLARRSHRLALATTWYEELRTAMASWRYVHRWVAVLLVLVLGLHIFTALKYARFGFGGGN
ncbi:MAG: hypothetical protein R3F17_04965, partial [Planctomycetota bacterium]